MKSFLRSVALVATMLGVQHVHGLGLGAPVVSSDMSSPLQVTVPLVGVAGSGVDLESVKLDVPGELEHESLGFPDPIRPRGLKVRLSTEGPGGPIVRLTTSRVSREPVLRFLLRAVWPGGQALREYELIIDPPAVARPRASRPGELFTARNQPRRGAVTRGLAAPRPGTPARAGERYGPVAAGDTLHRIASAAYPQRARNLAPVMQAIVERNPGAFIGGDPDRVLQGAFLDLPAAAGVTAAAPRAPVNAIAAPVASVASGYTVAPGDTLYSIARRIAAPGANLAGVVRRLFDANPAAFADGDMNRLLSGSVLSLDGIAAAPPVAATVVTTTPAAVPAASVSAEAVDALRARLRSTEQQVSGERARQIELRQRLDALLARVESLKARDAQLTARAGDLSRQIEGAVIPPSAISVQHKAPVSEVPAVQAEVPVVTQPVLQAAVQADGPVVTQPVLRAAVQADGPATAQAVAPVAAPAAVPAPRKVERARPMVLAPQPTVATGVMAFIAPLIGGPMGWLLLAVLAVGVLLLVLMRRFSATRIDMVEPRMRADEEATARKLAEVRERHGDTGNFEADKLASDAGKKPSTVHLTDAARAGNLAKEAAVHLAYEDYTAAKACITEAIRLDPHRDEHKMVLVTVYESTGEQDRARAIVNDLLTRREQLPGELRQQVEQLRQGASD